MSLPKPDHWHTRHFHQFLLESAGEPFVWGRNDCCLYAANAILAYTGVDVASEFRNLYKSEFGALRAIKEITGGSTVADAAAYCAQKHDLEEHQYPLMCKRGDLVVYNNKGTLIAGIIHLSGRHVVSISEDGPMTFPICDEQGNTNIVRSWSV
jgi:hypothetical protein